VEPAPVTNAQRQNDVVDKLWRTARSLQGGGVSYQDYVTELTFLLFLKMLEEQHNEKVIPKNCRWSTLKRLSGKELLQAYRRTLLDLGNPKTKGEDKCRNLIK